ncbi:MAG: histidine kinase, partial [Bacteroidia bacterium]
YDQAILYIDSSYLTYVLLGRFNVIDEAAFYDSYATTYQKIGDYKNAYFYMEKLYLLQDSLNSKTYNNKVLEFETKYATELKENKIQLQQLQISKQTQTRNILLLVFIIIALTAVWIYPRVRVKQIAKVQVAQLIAKNNLLDLQQKLLLTQMNPHFIFNSLKSIQSFVLTNNTHEASNYIADFGQLMRLILAASRKEYVTLDDELQLLAIYIKLAQAEAQHKFKFVLDVTNEVNEKLLDTPIPTMLLQPIVENAIHHGIAHVTTGAQLTIAISQLNTNYIQINVIDNGAGIGASTNKSGLATAAKILQERIALYNTNHDVIIKYEIVDLYTTHTQGTKVSLTIPIT